MDTRVRGGVADNNVDRNPKARMALQPGADVGSVPISDEMEEPCDNERDRRSEYGQNPPRVGGVEDQ